MKNPLSKTPFLFLLIPLLIGIILQYYFEIQYLDIALSLIGILAMFFSYLIPENRQFYWRWLFGFGLSFFILAIGIFTTIFRQQESEYTFSDKVQIYSGIIADMPQDKPKTVAYKVYLPDQDKKIICYFQRDSLQNKLLLPGDIFLFRAKIQPFKNRTDDFDYVRYMYNQGFAGSAYVSSHSWQATGERLFSLKYKALDYCQQILNFYKSLGFNHDEYAVLSALTLGYQEALTDDLKQGFRTTGTVHVLSVSGLHVGIIYMMISLLLSFIRKGTKYYFLKPILIICLLWVYAFITGLPPSVVRASLMLSIFCISEIFGRKNSSTHALYITAFFMLLYNPFYIFNIGFQLSFMSVLSILYLQPKVSGLLKVENRYLKNIWQMLALSLVAQLATFPLCLYYFGTFPTYFFAANLIVVPLVLSITYAMGGIAVAKLLSFVFPDLSTFIYYIPVKILQLQVYIMTSVIHFFENLPFSLVEDVKISFIDLFLIYAIIACFIIFFINKASKALIAALSTILLLFVIHIYDNLI